MARYLKATHKDGVVLKTTGSLGKIARAIRRSETRQRRHGTPSLEQRRLIREGYIPSKQRPSRKPKEKK